MFVQQSRQCLGGGSCKEPQQVGKLGRAAVSEEEEDLKLTILDARDRGTKMTMISVAPSKTCGEFIAEFVVAWLARIRVTSPSSLTRSPR